MFCPVRLVAAPGAKSAVTDCVLLYIAGAITNDQVARFFDEMPPMGDEGPRQRSSATNTATSVFKYGGSAVTDDGRDEIVVHYWSGANENVRKASGDLRLQQHRWANVTQTQQIRQLDTSSLTPSSVQSAAVVLAIAGTSLQFQLYDF